MSKNPSDASESPSNSLKQPPNSARNAAKSAGETPHIKTSAQQNTGSPLAWSMLAWALGERPSSNACPDDSPAVTIDRWTAQRVGCLITYTGWLNYRSRSFAVHPGLPEASRSRRRLPADASQRSPAEPPGGLPEPPGGLPEPPGASILAGGRTIKSELSWPLNLPGL